MDSSTTIEIGPFIPADLDQVKSTADTQAPADSQRSTSEDHSETSSVCPEAQQNPPQSRASRNDRLREQQKLELIERILRDGSRVNKKKPRTFVRKPLEGPIIKYSSTPESSSLTIPPHFSLFTSLHSKRPRDKQSCECGVEGKYCCPRTYKRFCSVTCFANLKGALS
mmetsp:Transcript_26250/g.46936  ORF Transcript_26250/g.46936 Transcript_26250/m.46936 type:complete len:168 (+) Transcript_26250:106-609(+)